MLLRKLKYLNPANRLAQSRDGNIATTFALTLLPVAMMVGFAVDFSYTQNSQGGVQSALDSAVLAAAKEMQTTTKNADIRYRARRYFDSIVKTNAPQVSCNPVQLEIDHKENVVDGRVTCKQAMTISSATGINEIEFTRKSSATYGVGKVDVAFVFDTSGSMGGSRMKDLKVAAKEAVKVLLENETKNPDDMRIALSSYASAVNVGEDYFQAVTDTPPVEIERCTKGKWQRKRGRWEYICQRSVTETFTCVTDRVGQYQYTDMAPGTAGKGNATYVGAMTSMPSCPSSEIVPLTTNETKLRASIDSMPTTGMTAGHLGLAWGWYLIAPTWKSIWPVDSHPREYDDPDTQKVVVLMTDGSFNRDYAPNGNSKDHAKKICDAMKAKGVIIYGVAFKAPKDGQQIIDYCSTNPGTYFDASSSQELFDAYKTIASNISDLRISK